jgi:hypothetical protein
MIFIHCQPYIHVPKKKLKILDETFKKWMIIKYENLIRIKGYEVLLLDVNKSSYSQYVVIIEEINLYNLNKKRRNLMKEC